MLCRGTVRDPRQNGVLDEVLLTIMRSLAVIPARMWSRFIAGGFSCAPDSGRWSRCAPCRAGNSRAGVLNGRLDLTGGQLPISSARTDKGVELALARRWGVSDWVREYGKNCSTFCQVEAAIDFPEEKLNSCSALN
jgi:hypothetical protein